MYRTILSLVGHDVFEVFGPSGSGKTTLAFALAIGAIREGKQVVFIDTERNVDEALIQRLKELGMKYYYFTNLSDVLSLLDTAPKADVYILDSLGMPALNQYAGASLDEKMNYLVQAIAVAGKLKELTHDNNALALITNQPESEVSAIREGRKKSLLDFAPFGDKHIFNAKEIWRSDVQSTEGGTTTILIRAWRSRRFPRGAPIAKIIINNSGVRIAFTKDKGRPVLGMLVEQAMGGVEDGVERSGENPE